MGGRERDPRGAVRAARSGSSLALDELFRTHWPAAPKMVLVLVRPAAARRSPRDGLCTVAVKAAAAVMTAYLKRPRLIAPLADIRSVAPSYALGVTWPGAEIDVDEALVRSLLAEQHPDLARLSVVKVDAGWDNTLWRLGDELLVRLPRRAVAAP